MPLGQKTIELGFSVEELSADKKKVLDILLEVYEATQKIDGTKIKPIDFPGFGDLKKSIEEQAKVITTLQTKIAELNKELANSAKVGQQAADANKQASQSTQQAAKSYESYTGALQENLRLQIQFKKELADVKQQQKDLQAAFAGSATSAEQLSNKQAELLKKELELKASLQQVNLELKQQTNQNQSVEGSYNQLSNQLLQLKNTYKQLSEAERAAAPGQELLKDIADIDTALKKIDADTGVFSRNVGNYKSAFSSAFETLTSELQQVKSDLSGLNSTDAGFAGLQQKAQLLEEVLGGVSGQFSSTRQEAKAFQEAAAKLGLTLGQADEQFLAFNAAVGSGTDALADIKAATKFQASDTKYIDGLVGAAQGLAGAYGIAQGAQQLFGDGSEDLQKSLQKLGAVMVILQGLQAIQNALQTESAVVQTFLAVKTFVLTAAQKIYQATMLQSTAATVAFRGSLILLSGGLLGILLLLPTIAAASERYSRSSKSLSKNLEDAATHQKVLNEVSEKAVDNYAKEKSAIELLVTEAQDENTAKGRKIEIIGELQKISPTYFDGIKTEADLTDKLTAATARYVQAIQLKATVQAATDLNEANNKALILRQIKLQEDLQDAQANKGNLGAALGGGRAGTALLKQQNRLIDEAADDMADLAAKSKPFLDIIVEANKELQQLGGDPSKGLDKTTKTKIDKSADEAAKKAEDAAKRILKALSDLDKERAQAEIDAFNRIASNEENIAGLRITATKLSSEKQEELINKQADDEILINQLTGAEVLAVRQRAANQIVELQAKTAKAISDILKKIKDQNNADALEKEKNFQDGINELGDQTLAKLKKRNKDKTDSDKEAADKAEELAKRLEEKKKEIAEASFDFATTLVDGGYEREKNAIQDLIDLNDERFGKEIEHIKNSTLSEQEKANTIAVLQAEQEAKKNQLEKRQRDAALKQAKFDRDAQALKILGETLYQAAKLGWITPLAIAVEALGAIEIATLLAKPLPKYAEGVEDHPGGFAIVGEGKHKELVQAPGSKPFIADKPTLLNLPLHTKVTPLKGNEINEMAYRAMFHNTATLLQSSDSLERRKNSNDIVRWQTAEIVKGLARYQSKSSVKINITDNADFKKYVDKNVRGK